MELPIPDEIAEQFDLYYATQSLVKTYLKLPFFGFRKAIKCRALEIKYHRKAWEMIYKLYPETVDKECTYYPKKQVLEIKENIMSGQGVLS
jgi:hypothetical protein